MFFGGDAAWGPQNIIWAVEHGHQAAISIHQHCQDVPVTERPAAGHEPREPRRWACTQWSYRNDFNPSQRAKMQHVELVERFAKLSIEVELGFTAEQTATKWSAASTATSRRTSREAVHRVRRLHRRVSGATA